MICIPIRYPESQKEKWVFVELQGTIHNIDGGSLNSQDLGTIEWINGKPALTIGNHLCEGTVVKLSKPIAILMKSGASDSIDTIQREYSVQAIITEKLLFSSRPRPLLQ